MAAGASDDRSRASVSLRADAEAIFRAALDRVDPAIMVERAIKVEGSGELVARTELEELRYDLRNYDRILVAGFGKAGARMALGLEKALGDRIDGGIVAVKDGHLEKLRTIELVESSHPVPDERSAAAAGALLALGEKVDERCLVIVLISGGGSSLLCAPAPGITLADKAETTRLLLASGAPIQEVNCVRKHISAVKGGRLAAALSPATLLSLILSDVIGDDLDVIASGPTVPDPTTWSDALGIVRRRGIEARLPPSVARRLRLGAEGGLPDTPKAGEAAFARSRVLLVGTNRLALLAAEAEARKRGYRSLVLTSRLTGEAREAALFLLGIGKDIKAFSFPLQAPACVILGGETTVTLKGTGRGGRNQEMALAFLDAMERSPKDADGILLLAASTDGSDGPTDAAGAFADGAAALAAREAGLDPRAFLGDNDSYDFFDRIGGLLRTGPTNTNVCDVQVLLVPRRAEEDV